MADNMKTQHGKDLGRPWAPNKRTPTPDGGEDERFKIVVVEPEPPVVVTKEEGTNRPIVTKPEKTDG